MTIDPFTLPPRAEFTEDEMQALWDLADRRPNDIGPTMLEGRPAQAVLRIALELTERICWHHGAVDCRAEHLPSQTRWLPRPPLPADLSSCMPGAWLGEIPVPARYRCLPRMRAELWRTALLGAEHQRPAATSWHAEITAALAAQVNDGAVIVDPQLVISAA